MAIHRKPTITPSVNECPTPGNTGAARPENRDKGVAQAINPRNGERFRVLDHHLSAGIANYPAELEGTADRCWVLLQGWSLTGNVRVSTREPGKPDRVRWSHRWAGSNELAKTSPMRRSGGGVSVVVRDGSAVHMAKGDRMFCFGQPKCSLNLEGSK